MQLVQGGQILGEVVGLKVMPSAVSPDACSFTFIGTQQLTREPTTFIRGPNGDRKLLIADIVLAAAGAVVKGHLER